MMRKIIALLLCICAIGMLSSCEQPKETTPLEKIQEWLTQDCSFQISAEFSNVGENGYTHSMKQISAKDGSYSFVDDRHIWENAIDYDSVNKREYYYRYENGSMVCYLKDNAKEVERTVLSPEAVANLLTSKLSLISAQTLLPLSQKELTDNGIDAATGLHTFTFYKSVEAELKTQSFLSTFLEAAFELYGVKYDPSTALLVSCHLAVEPDTFRPVQLTYDFTELKPYVLTDGSISTESALGEELISLSYEFSYNLADTIPMPEQFIKTN